MRTDDFTYELPEAAIAQAAIEPRDDARVLVGSDLSEIRFRNIPEVLRPNDLLVVNRTKVRAARLSGNRLPGGGKTELLLTKRIDRERWQALVKPAKRLSTGVLVECGGIIAEIRSNPVGGVATVALTADNEIEDAIAAAGSVPLPPYFHGDLPSDDRYQTVFAKSLGSSAAPTAGLHFTDDVVATLEERGIQFAEVELDVGLDTFRPMSGSLVGDHKIHKERIEVDRDTVDAVERTRRAGGRVIAVGTTVVRTLESVAAPDGQINAFEGETDLFIQPGYQFRVVDGMFTNFHAPRTTLIVMIAAILGDRWINVYEHAIRSGFRFLSFGDSMFLEVNR